MIWSSNCMKRALQMTMWTALLLLMGTWTAHAQTSIGEITGNPGRYSDEVVQVKGEVVRHVDQNGNDSSTKNYVLTDDSGAEIRAKTTQSPPEVGSRYQVEGLVSISPFNREPFIVEQSRSQLASASQSGDSGGGLGENLDTVTLYLVVGFGLLVLIIIGYFAYASQEPSRPRRRTRSTNGVGDESDATDEEPDSSLSSTELGGDGVEEEASEPDTDGFPEPSSQRIKSESSSSLEPEEDESSSPETLKFKAPPKTMKFVPGRLVIAAGPDQGKEFRIAGRPTPDGNVVTIGRAEVEGEKAFAHIQLGDTYRTVSRIQAEIVQQDDTILLRNKSETNPTMVNGEQVASEDTVELEDGDMIRMGELMMRYERD